MEVFFSAGEPSGDIHGAHLIRQLRRARADIRCVGYGGPEMAAAGLELHADLTRLAVMWFLSVFMRLPQFIRLYRQAQRYFRAHRPSAVVLIDYPGFNWWLAAAAKQAGIPVFYYGVPQLWAWGGWRVRKLQRLVDHVLCQLPFEEAWYRSRGLEAVYVGHPFFDEAQRGQEDTRFLLRERCVGGRMVTLLPGSRTQEVTANLPTFLRAAALIAAEVPHVRFAIAAFNARQAEIAERLVAKAGLAIPVHVGRTRELIQLAECCLACSGSVSLQLLAREKPTVILYQINRIAHWVQRFFRRVKYITLVNVLAAEDAFSGGHRTYDPDAPDATPVPFPEYLACRDVAPQIAGHIVAWLGDEARLQERVAWLRDLKHRYAHPGSAARAAAYVLDALGVAAANEAATRRPHFAGSAASPVSTTRPSS